MDYHQFYQGKTCIVTGATSGNGWALANRLLTLKAKVIGLGRNQAKLAALEQNGGISYQLDLSDSKAIQKFIRWFALSHSQCDFLFHLAGNALIGQASPEDVRQFKSSDLDGPISLMEDMRPYMKAGSTIATVTSGSVALGDIPVMQHYINVKNSMVQWYLKEVPIFKACNIHLMLISMGFIHTGIWSRSGNGVPRLSERLVAWSMPGPEHYTDMILQDAARQAAVSYPGFLASLAPFKDGKYHAHPALRLLLNKGAQWGLALFCKLDKSK